MDFKRKAIIIGASPKSDPLENVALDVRTWSNFLKSKHGGGWNENTEICIASDLEKADIIQLISEAKYVDYSMIIFAGHGFSVRTDLPWPELNLLLSSGETILERELNPGSSRCTLVLDCCRAHGENLIPLEEQIKNASLTELSEEVLARSIFENSLSQCEIGLVKVYATGDNSAAADKFSFSQILIQASMSLVNQNRGILHINDAVGKAGLLMKSIHPQQVPEYHGGRRLRHYPFALGL